MDQKEKPNAREIASTVMNDRPGYYSGRGAIRADLDSKRLEKICLIIDKHYGREAAKNFVQMVADIPVLSATDFLLTFYKLGANNWKWDKRLLGDERGVYPDDEASAFATVVSVMCGDSKRDETHAIRADFLRKYGIKTEGTYGLY